MKEPVRDAAYRGPGAVGFVQSAVPINSLTRDSAYGLGEGNLRRFTTYLMTRNVSRTLPNADDDATRLRATPCWEIERIA
jgi:hypothetical protein